MSNVVNRQGSPQNIIVLLETTISARIEVSKLAAINLVSSFSEDSKFSIILCDKLPLIFIEGVKRSESIAFISSSKLGTSSYVAEGYEKAKIFVKKGGDQKLFSISSDLGKVNAETDIKDIFLQMGCIFSNYIINSEVEGTLYAFKIRKYLTYYLPNFRIPFGILQTRRESILNYISVDSHIPTEAIARDLEVFLVAGKVRKGFNDVSTQEMVERFINMEFHSDWYNNNTDLEYIFPQKDKIYDKLRIYARYKTPNDKNWNLVRMNDKGLDPDSKKEDKLYTTAFYCKDLMTKAIYEINFLVGDVDHPIAKIFIGSAAIVKVIESQCIVDKILPAKITEMKCYKTTEIILCILIAVGNNGMRHPVTQYQGHYVEDKISKQNGFTCVSNKNPFEILCCRINNPQVNLNNLIKVQLQAIDDSRNVGVMSDWTIAHSMVIPFEVCNRTTEYRTTESIIITLQTTISDFGQTLSIRLYETLSYFILFNLYYLFSIL